MCGRVSVHAPSAQVIAHKLHATVADEQAALYRPRYNAGPQSRLWLARLVDGSLRLERARWGIDRGTLKNLFNANDAKLGGPAWKKAFQQRRCIIPTTGFFEWRTEGKLKRPVWFHPPEGELLLMAGLYDPAPEPSPEEEHPVPRFTIITTRPNALVATVRDRMPAILRPEQVEVWLAEPHLDLIAPASEGLLAATEVSSRVNSVKNDDPACLAPAETASTG